MFGRCNFALLNKYSIVCKTFYKPHLSTAAHLSVNSAALGKSRQPHKLLILPQSTTFSRAPFHSTTAQQLRQNMSADSKFKLTEVEGDLFSAPETHSLAHCVGADFAMGAGIAVKFKQIYGQVDQLRAQGVQSGGVAVLQDKERYIYYLVTKPQSWGSPTYDSLRASLVAMREHMRKNKVHKLAIPRIGCGIDGLEWDKVSAELCKVFDSEELEIVVYNFVPK
ncbi:PREDICTED: O-acetyl-ADP-ribose deacetylase 1-like isoform X2 [Bactrocera latifrons]|uniref:O-acetyl-ADP-ribose deacetylase C6orf130 n=2 Tax=Bactrocera latifrons TaxID=174628 RepID=A0A0K8W5U9_BACLA|nr:PREDICTED: O-acetyl-ADP-ribose deacetylase 1-like isoform X2 [Bactrocera latifrons]